MEVVSRILASWGHRATVRSHRVRVDTVTALTPPDRSDPSACPLALRQRVGDDAGAVCRDEQILPPVQLVHGRSAGRRAAEGDLGNLRTGRAVVDVDLPIGRG